MAKKIELNHTIVHVRDKKESALFLCEMLGLDAPTSFGHFLVVKTTNGVSLDFSTSKGEFETQHYAFLVSDAEFEEIFSRIQERGLDYWADPGQERAGEINHRDKGKGLYFEDPSGHLLEILTRPYGSGS